MHTFQAIEPHVVLEEAIRGRLTSGALASFAFFTSSYFA
jgi:hypothetical protein